MALTDLTRISTSGIATGSTIDSPILRKDVSLRGSQVGVTSALFDSSDDALEFNDNVKLKFGNSGDLQLYHDTNHSYIEDTGTGNLLIKSDSVISIRGTTVAIKSADNSQVLIKGVENAGSELYFNNNLKFITTNDGAFVTGILTATSFSGPLIGSPINNPSGISTFYDLRVSNNLTVEGSTTTLDTNLIGVDRVEVGANSNTVTGIAVTQSGTADIVRLYDGASQVVTVDDEGKVGLGTTTPSAKFEVNAGANVVSTFLKTTSAKSYIEFEHNAGATYNTRFGSATLGAGNVGFIFETGVASSPIDAMAIDRYGRVGIGSMLPTTGKLEIADSAQTNLLTLKRTSGNSGELSVQLGGSDPGVMFTTSGLSDDFVFRPGGNERLRINSSGNARIGGTSDTTDQGYRFTLQGSSNATYLQFFDNGTGTTHGSDGSYIGLANQDFYVWNREDKDIVFATNNGTAVTITNSRTIKLAGQSNSASIHLDTSDGSDNKRLMLAGGGSAAGTRGASLALFGNEYSGSEGQVELAAGNSGSANGTMRFSTGGTERLRISSSGDITAVNTTSGATTGVTLKIGANAASGTNSGTLILNNGGLGNSSIQFDYENSAARCKIYVYRSTNDIIFDTSNDEKLRILNSGLLRNQGTYNGSSTTTNNFPGLNINNLQGSYTANNIIGGVTFGKAPGHSSGIRAGILALYSDTGSDSSNVGTNLVFRTAGNTAGDSQERLRINSSGEVSIGTASGGKTLTLYGASSSSFRISKSGVLAYDHTFDGSSYTIANNNGSAGIPIIIGTKTGGGESLRITSAGLVGINDDSPTTKLNIKIATSTEWDSTKNVSNTTNLDFLALDLINTNNDTDSEVGLMMEAGSSSAAQMTISTKKVSANYAELAIRSREGGSASKEIWKIRGNGIRYVRTGATIDIPAGGAKDASITPNNGDYIDFARVNYAGASMGEIFIKWTSVVAPSCCHHGSAHLRIGTEYHTYFYGWNDWVDVISSAAHNNGWFSHWRLRRVVVSGTSYLYLQGKWDGSNVSAGNFQVVIGKSSYHPSGGGLIESVTPVVDNNANGDTSGSKTYMDVQAQVQGKREADSPATTGDRITKSHSGRFHAYLGLDTQGEISAYNQPRMSAYKTGGQNYDTTPTIVTYGTETFDNGNDYDPATGKFTCPMDGVYFVSYSANISASSNWGYLECRVNGSAAFAHTRIMHYNFPRLTFAGSNYCNCAQGDEIAIYGWTNTGTLSGDNFGLFQVYMLS